MTWLVLWYMSNIESGKYVPLVNYNFDALNCQELSEKRVCHGLIQILLVKLFVISFITHSLLIMTVILQYM